MTGDRGPNNHPAERVGDGSWPKRWACIIWRVLTARENWYRDVAILGLTAIVAWTAWKTPEAVKDASDATAASTRAVMRADRATERADRAIKDQVEGRKAAVQIICGVSSAIIDAGRATITGNSAGLPTQFERNLERLGYPPRHVRRAQARELGRQYAQAIAERVQAVADGKAKGIVRKNGTLNCTRLLEVSRVTP